MLLCILVPVFLVFLAAFALIRVPVVQTWAVGRVTSWLSSELKTTVKADAVAITFFSGLRLNGLYIEDLKHDTLLYVKEVKVGISGFSYKKQRLVIDKAVLNNPRIKLVRYADVPGLNIDFLADYFSGGTTDTTAKPWDVKVKKVIINNGVFSYRDKRWNDATVCMDYEDMVFSRLNLAITDIQPDGGAVKFHIDRMSAAEKCGFVVNELKGDMLLSGHDLALTSMQVKTDKSTISGDAALNFDSWEDFSDFTNKVRLKATFGNSRVSSEDVKFFAVELFGLDKTVSFKGNVRGTINNLKGKNLEIIYTPRCYFKGDIAMNGLPDFDETFIDLMANDLTINKEDIETINTFPFNEGKKIVLPGNIASLGLVKFKGKFTGFYTDFVAYGDANTALGFFSSDVNLKVGTENKPAEYSGNVVTHKFNLGKLLKIDPDVGEISAKVKVKGYSLALEKLNTRLEGTISQLTVKGYPYTGITVNGEVRRKLFKGSLTVNDPNADLDFAGTVDYSGKRPVFNFTSDIRTARLAKLNLTESDSTSNLKTHAELHFTGSRIDDIEGTVHFTNTEYLLFPQAIMMNNLLLRSDFGVNNRSIHLESDFADADITGDYKLSTFYPAALSVLSNYIPAIPASVKRPDPQTINFNVKFKETRGVLDVFVPDLEIIANTSMSGSVNSLNNLFTVSMNSEEIIYQGVRIGNVSVTGASSLKNLEVDLNAAEIQVNDSLNFRNVVISGLTNRDSADVNLKITNTDSSFSRINWDFDVHFLSAGATSVKLLSNEFLLEKSNWTIDPLNLTVFDTSGISIKNLAFRSEGQMMGLDGKAAKDTSQKLTVNLENFNSSLLNNILKYYNAHVGGEATGYVTFSSLLGKPVIESQLAVKSFSWFNDTLGDADVTAFWNTTKSRIEINAEITRGGEKNIAVNGAYIIRPKNDALDFNISLRKTYLKTFSPYLTGIFSNISGIVSGEFKLEGLVKEPELSGEAHLQKAGFKVDYLNTSYSFNADVSVTEDEISFNDVTVFDIKGNKAVANGRITHDHLRDFYFDIDITANKMQMLNTTPADNELYYGVGYGTGNINISGYLDYIKMDIAVRTDKGTQINIPLDNPEEISASNFVTFLQKDTVQIAGSEVPEELSGIELNMDFDVTTDAAVKLIFDDKIGDVIEGRGTGTLTMKVNDADGFLMFGNYYIESGQYTFTLQNIFSKPFTIEKGGSIAWTGDPYNADIDITAIYSKLKVSLYDLLQDTSANYKKSVPVILKLNLKEKLFNPAISFDIEVPNIDATTESRINRYLNTDEEKLKQAVSLLLIRRFSPPDELANRPGINTSSAVGTNAYEFASLQVSNWASSIVEDVDVNVNYNPGNNITQEALEFALATTFFNEKVRVEGSVNTGNAAQNASNIAGDFTVEYHPSTESKLRLKAFNRSNNTYLITNLNSQYTRGIGVFYREEFNTFSELTRKWFRKRP